MGIIQRQGTQSAIIQYGGMLVGFVSLLIVQPWLLTAEEVGLFRVIYSFAFLLGSLLTFGSVHITTYFINDYKGKSEGYFLRFLLFLPLIAIVTLIPLLFVFKDEIAGAYADNATLFNDYFPVAVGMGVTMCYVLIFSNLLTSLFKPVFPAFYQEILVRLLFIGLIVVYTSTHLSLNGFVGLYFLVFLVQALVLGVVSGRYISFFDRSGSIKMPEIKGMLSYGWVVFLTAVASMAMKIVDSLVLAQFVPLALVGVYSIAAFIPTFIDAPVNALERISNVHYAKNIKENNLQEAGRIYKSSARFLLMIGGGLVVLVWTCVPYVFEFLPAEYAEGVTVVRIMSIGALVNLLTGANNGIIFNSSLYKLGSALVIASSLLNLGLLYIIIPVYGIFGAAAVTCISSLIFNTAKYLAIKARFQFQPFDKLTAVNIVVVILTLVILSLIPETNDKILNLVFFGGLSAAFYLSALYVGGFKDELKRVRGTLLSHLLPSQRR